MCAVAACVAAAAPAAAQRPSGQPFSGLFKGSPREQPQTLDLQASGFAGWDDNVLALAPVGPGGGFGGGSSLDPRLNKPGVANGLQASLAYGFRRSGTRSQFSVGAGGSVQGFASALGADPLWMHSYSASGGLTTSITNRTSLSFSASAGYAPYYQYAPFLTNTTSEDAPLGTDYGYAVNSDWVRSTTAGVGVRHQLSKTSTITAGTSWSKNVVAGRDIGGADARALSLTFSHSLTRKLAFRVGYSLGRGNYATGTGTATGADTSTGTDTSTDTKPALTHNLDIGLGYGDGLSFKLGRHYVLSLSVGAGVAKNGDPKSVALTGKSTAFNITGSATLSRSLGRSWSTSIGYLRGTSYVVGFPQQILSDSANAGIGGPITRRISFSAGGGASRGQQLFAVSGGSIISYTGSARLSYAVFSHLGFYGQASYYRFSLPPGIPDFGFMPDLNRRSVSVGLSTWLPLIKQKRARQGSGGQPTTGQP